MDHWQTPVYSVQTYLHPLRREAIPFGITLSASATDYSVTILFRPSPETNLVLPAGIEPALPKENGFKVVSVYLFRQGSLLHTEIIIE